MRALALRARHLVNAARRALTCHRLRPAACPAWPKSALHNAAEAGDTELLAKLLAGKDGADDDFDPVSAT